MSTAVAAPIIKKAKPFEFDDAKLATMVDSITMNIDRVIGGKTVPVTQSLPVKPGQEIAGVGWGRDDVKNLNEYLVQHMEPGLYRCTATDEAGVQMKWEAWLPSTAVEPTQTMAPPVPIATAPPVSVVPPPAQSYMPFGGPAVPQPSWLHTAPYQLPQNAYGIPGGYGGGLPAQNPLAFAQQLRPAGETDQLRQEREARLQLEGKIERERLENRYKEQMGSVQSEVRQLHEALRTTGSETASEKQLKAQLDDMRRQNEQSTLAQLMDRGRQDMMTMIAALKDSADKQMSAVQAQIAAIAAKPSGPDPTMMLMMEMMKTNAAAAQAEQLRQLEMYKLQQQQSMQFQQMQMEANKSQMGPREWIELAKSSNQSGEQQAAAFGKAFELMMQGVETILQAQGPQVHPALQMLGEGIQGAIGIGQKVVETRQEAIHAQAAVGQQQAQANAMLAQEIRANRMHQQQLPAAQAPVDPNAPTDDEDDGDDEEDDETDDAPVSDNVIAQGQISVGAQAERKKHEKQLFGDAFEDIRKLRAGVRSGALDSQKAAIAIAQGVSTYVQAAATDPNVKVPVFQLWVEGRVAELVDQLLPEAKDSFRMRVVETIAAMKSQLQSQIATAQARAAASEPPLPRKARRPVAAS